MNKKEGAGSAASVVKESTDSSTTLEDDDVKGEWVWLGCYGFFNSLSLLLN